ncbi:LysE family transporter [Kiloniella laminariae]|uniref:LysE family transporter n=1 Tax=Kiloniella laminariae TaxID=454162 RepID=A0ABT4LLV5_9PROT|nr:LysE family transporter [Kiloniella laminariae]MCZ4282098.1 LysE family transporter [Kiloniella laminariae]
MAEAIAIISILGVLAIGAITPGPSFILVAQISLSRSRSHGIAAAAGMGAGAIFFAILALLGLQLIFIEIDWLYAAFKVFGGLYLLYLGIRIWRGAKNTLMPSADDPAFAAAGLTHKATCLRAFFYAFMTQISNPKAAIIYSGVFAVFLPAEISFWFPMVLLPAILLLETGWYLLVACALSAPVSRNIYLRAKCSIDRIAGSLMGLLGIKLMTS